MYIYIYIYILCIYACIYCIYIYILVSVTLYIQCLVPTVGNFSLGRRKGRQSDRSVTCTNQVGPFLFQDFEEDDGNDDYLVEHVACIPYRVREYVSSFVTCDTTDSHLQHHDLRVA